MMTEQYDRDPFNEIYDKAGPAAASGAILASVYSEIGEAGLRGVLEMLVSPTAPPGSAELMAENYIDKWRPASREHLIAAAEELDIMGLVELAEIVMEYQAKASEEVCPYPEGTANARNWTRRNTGIWKGYRETPDTVEQMK